IYESISSDELYDPARGSKCIDELNATQSKATFCDMPTSDVPDCDGFFHENGSSDGTKQPGEPCENTSDCAAQSDGAVVCFTSFDSNQAETRVCQVQLDGKAGDMPCLGTRDGYATYSYGSTAGPPPPRGYVCDLANNVYCSSKTKACT